MGMQQWEDLQWTEPLPDWVREIRPHQYQAMLEIKEAFDEGMEMVVVSAPTGSGKTLLGELARRIIGERGLYVCNGLALQDQFVRDFHAPVLNHSISYMVVSFTRSQNFMSKMAEKPRLVKSLKIF